MKFNYKNRRIFDWLLVFAWAGLIFIFSSFSSLPGPEVNLLDFVFKKSAHVFVYLVLSILIINAKKPKKNQEYLIIFLSVIMYAISDEIHQAFVPGRSATLMDIGFDSIGASLGYIISQTSPFKKYLHIN